MGLFLHPRLAELRRESANEALLDFVRELRNKVAEEKHGLKKEDSYKTLALAVIDRALLDFTSKSSSPGDREDARVFLLEREDMNTRHWFEAVGLDIDAVRAELRRRFGDAIR